MEPTQISAAPRIDRDPPPVGAEGPQRRRDARLLVAPFIELLASPRVKGAAQPPPAEMVVDLSRRGLSFFTRNEDLLARPEAIETVVLDAPDGLSATIGVGRAQVRRPRPGAPARVALEFDVPRPAFRTDASLRRVGGGFYAPFHHEDTLGLVRAILGADDCAERRSADRIRVPLEMGIVVRFEGDAGVFGEATLADVSPHGLGCVGDASLEIPAGCRKVRLFWQGRELLAREVQTVFCDTGRIRGEPRTRVRVVLGGDSIRPTWDLPLWTGPREFGRVRFARPKLGPALVQAALLAKEELQVCEAVRSDDVESALDLSYATYVEDGLVDPTVLGRDRWRDEFDDHSILLVAKAGDLVAGTIRLVRESRIGLPHRGWTPEELWPTAHGMRVEAGRLAVSKAYRPDVNARLGVATLLIAAAVQKCVDEGIDELVMGARVSHERFYRAIGLVPISPVFPHARLGWPSRLMKLDVTNPGALRRVLRWYRAAA